MSEKTCGLSKLLRASLRARNESVCGDIGGGFVCGGPGLHAERVADDIGVELAGARDLAGHATRDANILEPEKAPHRALDQRVTVLEDQQIIDVFDKGAHHACRQWILAYREDREVVVGLEVFVQIVGGKTADDDTGLAPELE